MVGVWWQLWVVCVWWWLKDCDEGNGALVLVRKRRRRMKRREGIYIYILPGYCSLSIEGVEISLRYSRWIFWDCSSCLSFAHQIFDLLFHFWSVFDVLTLRRRFFFFPPVSFLGGVFFLGFSLFFPYSKLNYCSFKKNYIGRNLTTFILYG